MRSSTFTLASTDGVSLFVYRWLPEVAPKAAVQIAHGLVEHAGRYARLAKALTYAGYAVYAADHRGHGRTASTPEDFGFFAERDGWRKCIDDLWRLNRRIATDLPGLPIVLIGHSMGSFRAQHFISEHGEALSGVVLVASNGRPAPLTAAAKIIAHLERLRLGPRSRSAPLHSMVVGAFNKPFEPIRTEADWLSRDLAEVDKYVTDPFCQFRPTVQLWIDLLDASGEIAKPARHAYSEAAANLYHRWNARSCQRQRQRPGATSFCLPRCRSTTRRMPLLSRRPPRALQRDQPGRGNARAARLARRGDWPTELLKSSPYGGRSWA